MDFKIGKTQAYVNNPISRLKSGNNVAALRGNHYVSNTNMLRTMNSFNRMYGQSPEVNDYANAGQLLNAPVLRHICMA